jgi:hypothetical protein
MNILYLFLRDGCRRGWLAELLIWSERRELGVTAAILCNGSIHNQRYRYNPGYGGSGISSLR